MINVTHGITVLSTLCLLSSCRSLHNSRNVTSQRPVRGVHLTTKDSNQVSEISLQRLPAKTGTGNHLDVTYEAFFARLVSLENKFTEKDRQILVNLPARPTPGTIQEAAIVVGVLREVLTPRGNDDSSQTPSAPQSLELRAQDKEVDIIGALASNPYLKTSALFTMALEAVTQTSNTQAFSEKLLSTIRTEILNWNALAAKLEPNRASNHQSITSNANATPIELTPANSTGVPTPSPTNALQTPAQNSAESPAGDSDASLLLSQALELAAKAQLAEAIGTAKKIPANSAAFESAKQNIRVWSDRATQDLRKQAAQQYRASSSVSDPSGKKVYLSSAKNLLEEAINKYPDSSNLDTIKENLEIIDEELGRLK